MGPDHLLTFANMTTFHLSKANLLDCLRLDSQADSFEESPGGRSRCRSGFQVGVLSAKATAGYNALLQPGALVMQAVGGSYLHHMIVAGHHNWCRKLHTLAARRAGGEPGTCHLGRPQPHQCAPESDCTRNRLRQNIFLGKSNNFNHQ